MQFYVVPPVRGQDCWGQGHYLASRVNRLHNGVDFSCQKGSFIPSMSAGVVTKIGFPHRQSDKRKKHLRYVQVTDAKGNRVRYFYVEKLWELGVGSTVLAGDIIGISQGLLGVYKNIIDHIHFEVIDSSGEYIDPHEYLESL